MSNGAIELYIIDDVCANRRLNVEWYSGDSIVEDLSFYIEIRQARFFLSVTHHAVLHHAEPAIDTRDDKFAHCTHATKVVRDSRIEIE